MKLQDSPPERPTFIATYTARDKLCGPESLPHTWTEVERLVESRLQAFEARHRLECHEAFENGRLEGRREREREVNLRLQEASGPWRALQEAVLEQLAAYRQELYRATTELSAALARAWLGTIVELNPHAFEAGIRKALEPLSDQEELEVRLNPEDYARYRDSLHQPDALLFEAHGFTLAPDAQVDRGGAMARSRGGVSDARIAVRIQKALEWLHAPHDPS